MKDRDIADLSGLSMQELFRAEVENQCATLTAGLLELERTPASPGTFEVLMRAAHSLKGAARIVNLEPAVRVAHALEDCFVAAQAGKTLIRERAMDLLLRTVDLLAELARRPETDFERWSSEQAEEIENLLRSLSQLRTASQSLPVAAAPGMTDVLAVKNQSGSVAKVFSAEAEAKSVSHAPPVAARQDTPERLLRLNAENLNRLLALAGESMVESRWLRPFADSLERAKRQQAELLRQLERLRNGLDEMGLAERTQAYFSEIYHQLNNNREFLSQRVQELEMFDRRLAHLSQRLYLEVLRTRMRPFSDCSRRFPRMVRDLARALEKQVRLEVSGEQTQVDREILERLQTPLAHLLRNAVDHGCEPAPARRAAGKPIEAVLRLDVRQSAGALLVTVADDGGGVSTEQIREAILRRKLVNPDVAATLSQADLLQFLFLPGFTLRETVTEISGRGFGLDLVQNMVKNVRGTIRLTNVPGQGFSVQLQLPLTLSVIRALLVEIAGEPYAFPLGQILRAEKVPPERVQTLEGRKHFEFEHEQIGLFAAREVLDCGGEPWSAQELPVVVLSNRKARYGLVVDKFLGQRELVVQPLDPRLGQLEDISSAALMENGAPVLVINVEELLHSVEKLVTDGRLRCLRSEAHV